MTPDPASATHQERASHESVAFLSGRLCGQARLFPLPNLVLFPHVVQPLHIFEPRYRQLMADALADDRLIAMALLRPGWEEDYHGNRPSIPWSAWAGSTRKYGWPTADTIFS